MQDKIINILLFKKKNMSIRNPENVKDKTVKKSYKATNQCPLSLCLRIDALSFKVFLHGTHSLFDIIYIN